MSATQWTSYVGVVTGSVVALIVIASAILGWLAYRRSHQTKSLDFLRHDLRGAINQLASDVFTAKDMMSSVKASRRDVMAATGRINSGAMEQWLLQFAKDENVVGQLAASACVLEATNLHALKLEEMEAKAAELHKVQTDVTELLEKFRVSMEVDDKSRVAIRQAKLELQRHLEG